MSYNQGYGQNNQQGYGQYNPYGQQNPYDQRGNNQSQGGYNSSSQSYSQGNPYAQQDDYNQQRPAYQQHSSSRYDEEQARGGYEMAAVGGRGENNTNSVLNEVRAIDAEVVDLKLNIKELTALRSKNLHATNPNEISETQKLDQKSENLMATYKALDARMTLLKKHPESGSGRNAPQVGRVGRTLRDVFQEVQRLDKEYYDELRNAIERQILIVYPDASKQEIREIQEDLHGRQVFSEAIMNTDRRGNAQAASRNVKARHMAIAKLERDMMIVAQLIINLETEVIRQEDQVAAIDDKADVTQEHVTQGTVELDGAIVKAKGARNKKRICLGIVILIILIAIGVAVGVVEANKAARNP